MRLLFCPPGLLYCVNNFVRSVTCTWKNSAFKPSSDCWVSGVKTTSNFKNNDLQHTFNSFEKLPNISMICNGTLIETQKNYNPKLHIKLHRPGAPNVTSSANMTRIWWRIGSQSRFLELFDLQVQIKRVDQSWDESVYEFNRTVSKSQLSEMIIWQKLKGHLQVRVRIKSGGGKGGQFSEWSPTTSWIEEDEVAPGVLIFLPLALSLGLSFASVLAIYGFCIRKRNLKEKPVPNPSLYFCSLHEVYGGNLKKWLNPVPLSEPFFVSRPCEDICAVELCESWDVVPSSSPCSSLPLVHSSAASDPLSSCSSSCFSNMDYFMSSGTSSSTHTHANPNYQGDVPIAHRKLYMSLCPPFISSSIYESLRMEPQSPDSGFGVGRFEEQDMEDFHENQSSPLLLRLPLKVSSFSPEPPFCPPDHLSGWPVTEPMCRASSLPVDTCKSGYLTLKELHTTFSNKSI
uniref:Interleukin-2 receptor subunit beta N-terminal domain-containing protein n=1 Tax=Periophthalmus magnuspinnatus TaxID=409849 RepID=A0A3B4AC06_9GOBI